MLSIETENKIAKWLLCLSDYHFICQKTKSCLNSDCQFDPSQVFHRLDRLHKGYIDAYDLITFFKEHFVYCSLDDAMRIVMWYDYNLDGLLTYPEFANLILAEETRTITSIRSIQCCCLPYCVELGVLNVFSKELEANRISTQLLMDIKCRFDFSPQSLLGAMKGIGYVNKENIKYFLIRTKLEFNEKDVENIMMRLDIQRNYRVSLSEIERIFYYPNEYQQKSTVMAQSNFKKTYSSIASNTKNQTQNLRLSQSPGQKKKDTIDYKASLSNASQLISHNSFNVSNSLSKPLSAKQSNDNLLSSLFSLLVQSESQIEQMKTELALRSDFNVEDAFSVFESNDSGLIYASDLRYGLNCFGLTPTTSEVHLLMQKYSLMNTNSLNYADLFDMLVPFDKDARMMIEKRLPSPFVPKYDRTNCFLGGTKEVIARLIEFIIISENKLEVIRKQISKKYCIDLNAFCEEIDIEKKRSISNENLWNYLSKQQMQFTVTQRESDLLFIRLDRNRNGHVEYGNIIRECDTRTMV